MNVKWHEQHVMPKRASLEQRIEWHREHQAECACRPIPARLLEQMAQPARKSDTASKSAGAAQTSQEATGVAAAGVAENKFSNIVLAFAHQPSVTYGGKGFGSSALKLSGKIFAMLTSKGQFVVKLSRERVEELVGLSEGEYFEPGHGRLMKDWFLVPASSTRWLELAREAHATASGRPSRISRPPPGPSAATRFSKARAAKARLTRTPAGRSPAAKAPAASSPPAKKRRVRAS